MTVVVEQYQSQTEALAAASAAQMLALYAALQAGGLAPSEAVAAMAGLVNAANAAATTLADVAVSTQIEAASGVPTPPTGIAPRDDSERLVKAVQTILDDLDEDQDHGDEPDDDEDQADERDSDDLDKDHGDELEDEDHDEEQADETREDHADEDRAEAPREDHEPDQGHAGEPDQDHASDDHADPSEVAANRLERLARSEPLDTGQAVTVEIIDRLPQVEGWTRLLDADPCARCVRWAEDGRVFPTGHHFKRHYGCSCQMQIVTKEIEGTAS
ncbi:MAG: hypothetical protein EKK34_22080 [Mycobacterium sp.]|nr:MAG: hypothetical protein EKK34_22080 [Mycobacterium sp.]